MFGPHLMIEGKAHKSLDSLPDIFNFLNKLPEMVGMTKITQPHVFPYEGLVPEDKGITGAVIIAESHITVHTFTDKKYIFMDIFSCKDFDVEFVKAFTCKYFQIENPDIFVEHRGKAFPR